MVAVGGAVGEAKEPGHPGVKQIIQGHTPISRKLALWCRACALGLYPSGPAACPPPTPHPHHTHTHARARARTHTYIHTRACTHTHTHTHTHTRTRLVFSKPESPWSLQNRQKLNIAFQAR